MVKVTLEFASEAEACAYLTGKGTFTPPAKKAKKEKTASIDDDLDGDDGDGLGDESDDLDDLGGEPAKTLAVQIQERAAAIAAADKKAEIQSRLKKVGAKKLSEIPADKQQAFLNSLMKVAI